MPTTFRALFWAERRPLLGILGALKCSTLTKYVQLILYMDNLNKWVSGWVCVCICVHIHIYIYIYICICLRELDECEFAFLP